MTENKILVLLLGKSGTGKTTVSFKLKEKHNWSLVDSYTTRPARFDGEPGHVFVSEAEFNRLPREEMMAYMHYRGYQYGSTSKQLNNADLYVVEPSGYQDVIQKYHGTRKIVPIILSADSSTIKDRMRKRGTTEKEIQDRLKQDEKLFKNVKSISLGRVPRP